MGIISWIVLHYLRQDFPYLRITSIYFVSQAAKYLPGGIWAFPSRVIAYQAIGVPRAASVISLVQEVAALFLAAAGVGVMGLVSGVMVEGWVRTSLIAGAVTCILAVVLAQHPRMWMLMSRLGLRRSLETPDTAPIHFSLAWLPGALLPAVLFWLLVGLGFRWLVISIDMGAAQMTFLEAAGIFALAWCVGFVIVIAPAGLGVREAALAALLLPYLPLGQALGAALAARLWWTLGEALFIVLSVAWNSGKPKTIRPH
jgi:hypothetical protein